MSLFGKARDALVYSIPGFRKKRTELAGQEAVFLVDGPREAQRAENVVHEAGLLEWLVEEADGSVLWDVGAHHGTYSVIAALSGAEVYAFEPVASSSERIWRNAMLNNVSDSVWAIPVALGAERDTCALENPGRCAETSIVLGGEGATVLPGDDIEPPRPDLLKIDVEGHEVEVLKGMANTLKHVERMVVEVHPGTKLSEPADMMMEAGLDVDIKLVDRSERFLTGER